MKSIYDQEKELFKKSFISKFSSILLNGVWHVTSLQKYFKIEKHGYIEPNLGDRPFTYPQTKNSFGYNYGYISLFDFESAGYKKCIKSYSKWISFFKTYTPYTIAIQLDRKKLKNNLISNRVAKNKVGYKQTWIPWVEAWYDGSISTDGFLNYLVIFTSKNPVKIKLIKNKKELYNFPK